MSRVTTVAGSPGKEGYQDGRGDQALFSDPMYFQPCSHLFPSALATDSHGNLFIVDDGNHRIRKMTPDGTVTTIAGSGVYGHKDGPALEAQFGWCEGITVSSDGTIYFSDTSNHVIRKL